MGRPVAEWNSPGCDMRETLKTTNLYAKLVVALLLLVWLAALLVAHSDRPTVAQVVDAIGRWRPF